MQESDVTTPAGGRAVDRGVIVDSDERPRPAIQHGTEGSRFPGRARGLARGESLLQEVSPRPE